jgi:ATP-binding protein involved in chromosome partitioning
LDTPFLGRIPLDPAIVEGGDAGVPIVVAQREGPYADAFRRVAEAVVAEVAKTADRPKLSIV